MNNQSIKVALVLIAMFAGKPFAWDVCPGDCPSTAASLRGEVESVTASNTEVWLYVTLKSCDYVLGSGVTVGINTAQDARDLD